MIGLEVIETKYFLTILKPTCGIKNYMCLNFVSKINALHLDFVLFSKKILTMFVQRQILTIQ